MSSTHLASALVARFEHLRMTDVEAVGGKNASLGEMISQLASPGVRVPGGFATTAHAFRQFLAEGGLARRIGERLARLDTDDVRALAEAGAEIRGWIEQQPFPPALEAAIRSEYERLAADSPGATFAVRSSATAEDLPDASFAGQQETFLNVVGIDAGAGEDEGGLRQPLQRPRHQLPRAQGLRARRRRALGRRAAHGAQRPRRGRRDVHDRHRERLHRRRLHHLELRPRRDGGAGRRQSRRVLRPQAGAAARQAGDHPPQPRLQADPHGVRLGRGAARARQAGDDRGHRHRAAQPLFAERRRRRPSWPATPS